MPNTLSWRPKHSVKIRVIIIQTILTIFLVVLLAAFLYFPTRQSIEDTSNEAYFVLTNNLVATVFSSLVAGNNEEVISAAKKIEGVKGVSYVIVQDGKDKVIYDSLHELENKDLKDAMTAKIHEEKNVVRLEKVRSSEKYYEYAAPFLIDNEPVAIVRIAVAQKTITGEFEKLGSLFLRVSAVVLVIGIIVSYFISTRITDPIRRLTESALAIRAGNLNIKPNINTDDEMEQLSREFRRMVDQLKIFYLKEVREKEKAVHDYKRLEQINRQLKELDNKKNEFLSIASHQLRTPLSVILWTSSLIKEKSYKLLQKREQKMLDETEKNARLMESLINELLDLSRIQKNTRKLTITPVDIVDFVNKLFTSFQTLSLQKNINLRFEKGSVQIPVINSDKQSSRHIISNLIDNAIRYTEKNGSVLVRLDYEKEHVLVQVKDTGIGITEEEKSEIFKQFTRGARALRISPDGSGLGLYLVKQLVDLIGAEISVDSKPGRGSTFTVSFPINPVIQPEKTATIVQEAPGDKSV